MTIYEELQPVAAQLLKEFKQGVTKLISVSTSGNADAPTVTETETILDAAVKGISRKYVRDGFSVESDLEVTAAVVAGVTPTLKDYIEIDGIRYKIVRDISVPAAGTRVAWKFIVRRGG